MPGWQIPSRRAADTGRKDQQPDSNPSQPCFAVKCGRLRVEMWKEGGARNPKLRIVGVVGAGLHAHASARLVGAPLFLK